jgi:hypothetical protein
MMPTSETDVREMLEARARTFSMPPQASPTILRRGRRRRSSRGIALAGAVAVAIAGVVGLAPRLAPEAYQPVIAGPTTPSAAGTSSPVHLVSYLLPDTATGGPGVMDGLRAHIDCMRAQGFDIPDAVRTADGWLIEVDPSVVDVGSTEWREAAFVTCRLPVPASGNFILGMSQERVERFVACVSDQGFDLPEPTHNDDGEFVFDLTETNIDMSDPAWNRAAFVTCSPDIHP